MGTRATTVLLFGNNNTVTVLNPVGITGLRGPGVAPPISPVQGEYRPGNGDGCPEHQPDPHPVQP